MANLPPQAYTRETLSKAYEWLKEQPSHIQELARNADSLVSLYLQSRRRGGLSFSKGDSPSTQSFKSDLKNLANDLRQFDGGPAQGSGLETPMPSAIPVLNLENEAEEHEPPPVKKEAVYQMPPESKPPLNNTEAVRQQARKTGLVRGLDDRSWEFVKEVQRKFNLSSEAEALRLLITLGYEKVREFLPRL